MIHGRPLNGRSSIDADIALRALAHPTRRATVRHLADAKTDSVSLVDLGDALSAADHEAVAVPLHHN